MDQHLIFLLLGLANGAVFAALALAWWSRTAAAASSTSPPARWRCSAPTSTRSCARASCCCRCPGLPEDASTSGPDSGSGRRRSSRWRSARSSGCCSTSRVPAAARGAGGGQGGGVDRRDGRVHRALRASGSGTTAVPVDADPARRHAGRSGGVRISQDRVWFAGDDPRRSRSVLDRGLPVHPVRAAHPGRGRDREGRLRQRHLARPDRRGQLDDQRRGRRRSPAS